MFKNNEEDTNYRDNIGGEDTVIGSSIKIEGDLVSNGSISVEGEVVGSLKTEKTLTVGAKAKVTAEVKANDAFVSGRVQGNMTINGKLELAESAEVNGDITVGVLSIAPGAVLNGRCSMTENAPANKAGTALPSNGGESEDEADK